MVAATNGVQSPLQSLIAESFARRELHPFLKRLVLHATQTALQQVTPDNYFEKCHGAALAIHLILRTLGIRSSICAGTVSWLFGGTDAHGAGFQVQCGFWTPNPALPSPHAWVVTEFGGLVDLTCSFFHMTMRRELQSTRSHDVIPPIWMKTEQLQHLPFLRYRETARYGTVDVAQCDELAQRMTGLALANFWVNPVMEALQARGEPAAPVQPPPLPQGEVLEGPNLEMLRRLNSWVARNSEPPAATLLPSHGVAAH